MLQALSERGELITPAKLSRAEIKELRQQLFRCPECHEKVIIRAGPRVTPHFAHLPESTCSLNRHGESNYHKRAKLLLFNWLQKQKYPKVHLEKYLPTIKQRPDILLETKKGQVAVEFQSATTSPIEISERNQGYASENIFPLWILGKNQFKNNRQHYSYRINSFHQQFIKEYGKENTTSLLYFCPEKSEFTILNDLYFYRANDALAKSRTLSLHECSNIRQLFTNRSLSKQVLLRHWYFEKKRLRTSPHRVTGKELQFRKWLYEKRLHLEQLPSIIHLPIRSQYRMNAPLWHWQSKLIIDLLDPLPIGASVTSEQCEQVIYEYAKKEMNSNLKDVINEYFYYLQTARLFKLVRYDEWIKTRDFRFHSYIEASLRADRLLIHYLLAH